jgi:hypothetical protein
MADIVLRSGTPPSDVVIGPASAGAAGDASANGAVLVAFASLISGQASSGIVAQPSGGALIQGRHHLVIRGKARDTAAELREQLARLREQEEAEAQEKVTPLHEKPKPAPQMQAIKAEAVTLSTLVQGLEGPRTYELEALAAQLLIELTALERARRGREAQAKLAFAMRLAAELELMLMLDDDEAILALML